MEQENKMNSPHHTPLYIYLIVGLLVLVLALQGYLSFFKTTKAIPKDIAPKGNEIQELKKIGEVATLEKEVTKTQEEIASSYDKLKQQGGKKYQGVDPLISMSKEQQKIYADYIKKEQNVSLKFLLQEILEKNKEIWELNDKIAKIESRLPPPYIAKEGELHFNIAMNFLIKEKHLDEKRARKLIEDTLLMDPLKPGFKVWNFYSEGVFLSSVTQGKALLSPNTVIQQEKQDMINGRKKAELQRDKMAADIKELEKRKSEIQEQMDKLNKERNNLIGKVSTLYDQINSLSYLVDSEKNLKKRGIIDSGFLKSTKFIPPSNTNYNNIVDLRSQYSISISAYDYGMEKIKSVIIYPTFYKKGITYDVEFSSDMKTSTVSFLKPEEFKNKQIVISIK